MPQDASQTPASRDLAAYSARLLGRGFAGRLLDVTSRLESLGSLAPPLSVLAPDEHA